MITKRVKRALLSLCGLFSLTAAVAQIPSVEASVAPDSIGIGDRFTYSIEVERDLMQMVEFPEFETKAGDPIEVIESLPVDTISQDGRRLRLRKRYTLTTFEDGIVNLGVARVLYLDKNVADTLTTSDSLMLQVGTFIIDSTSQSIFDLKAQRNMPFMFAEVKDYTKWTLLALLILAVAIYFIGRALNARGKKFSDLFKPAPPVPPHIEAISALEALHNQKLWQNDKYKEYYSQLSGILRHYIARRYSISAMEMTSDEIIAAMKSVEELPKKSNMDLISILREADLVKFAKATPEGEQNEAHYLKAYYFVEETKIQEEIDPNAEEELFDVNAGQNNK